MFDYRYGGCIHGREVDIEVLTRTIQTFEGAVLGS